MKEFLRKCKERFCKPFEVEQLIIMYILKVILMPNPALDIGIFLILAGYLLGQKLLGLLKEGKDQYFEAKNKVISENEFRLNVNKDIGKIMTDITTINMKIGEHSLNKLNRKI